MSGASATNTDGQIASRDGARRQREAGSTAITTTGRGEETRDSLTLEDANCVRQLLRRNRNASLLASLEPLFDTIGMPSTETGDVLASLAGGPGFEDGMVPAAADAREEREDEEDADNNEGDFGGIDDDDVPRAFLCPITLSVMREPVVCADGHTYERRALAHWLRSHDTSPMTGKHIDTLRMTPNYTLKSMIDEHIQNVRRNRGLL